MRLLFASIHSYLDPSSGAALATREMLELLAGRGVDCRVLSAGVLDHERETSLDEVLATLDLPAGRFQAELGTGRAAKVIDLNVNGVRVMLMPTTSSRAERSPVPRESAIFLELAEHGCGVWWWSQVRLSISNTGIRTLPPETPRSPQKRFLTPLISLKCLSQVKGTGSISLRERKRDTTEWHLLNP